MYRQRSKRVVVIYHCHFGFNTSGAGQKTSSESAAAEADTPLVGGEVKPLWPCKPLPCLHATLEPVVRGAVRSRAVCYSQNLR